MCGRFSGGQPGTKVTQAVDFWGDGAILPVFSRCSKWDACIRHDPFAWGVSLDTGQ